MATSAPAIPPFDKISLIGIWIETVLWGMNCVVFAGACWVLFFKPNARTNRWMLGITSTLLFSLATAHVAGSLRALLVAFIYVPQPAPPLYATLYFIDQSDGIAVMKTVLYDTAVFIQDMVLIWRLYIVWNRNWKLCVFPVIVEMSHMAVAYSGSVLLGGSTTDLPSGLLPKLGRIGWGLDLALNVSVTVAIAARLWYMGRKLAIANADGSFSHDAPNAYLVPIFTIIESGALFAVATLVLLILLVTSSPLNLTGIDVATQLAVLAPLLIIVRVGLGLTHGLPSAYKSYIGTKTTVGSMSFGMNPLKSNAGSTTYGGHSQISVARNVDISRTMVGSREVVLDDFKAAANLEDSVPAKRS
ncbi:hypothetical protein OBBRIDRAFT_889115 [Obba rivulosa]|uniref:Uncharacterized protein n=1 Tax=Obba rivulosa TaxID=1052685 RepID=A0A8E2APD1_9APHY|nr:hypothetical protein OBBRIDRAFT_889115 [Obba rivulosa]